VEGRLAIGYGGQFQFSGRLHNPTSGFDLHRRQWSRLNRFRTGQGHCNACHKKVSDCQSAAVGLPDMCLFLTDHAFDNKETEGRTGEIIIIN